MNFFTELKRRNVFKLASVYMLTTWLVLQIISVISPYLNLPQMFGTIVTVILFIGFPVACVIAWAFELTPQGIKLTQDVTASDSIGYQTGQKLNATLMAIIVLLLCFIVFDKFYTFEPDESKEISIAVLPFQDMSPDQSQEYFGDGIAEEILNSLARLNKMLVISRTSSFQFKKSKDDIRKIGKLLGANYVLEGSVRKDNQHYRITAQLIEVSTGMHLWSQTYDKKLDSIFAMQDELTYAITQALKLNLLPEEVKAEVGMTTNQAAYDLFLRGRELGYQRNGKDLNQAREYLEQSIALDNNFHLAKAQLYIVYDLTDEYGEIDNKLLNEKHKRLYFELSSTPEQFPLKTLIQADYLETQEKMLELASTLYKRAVSQAPNDTTIQNYALLFEFKHGRISDVVASRQANARLNPLDIINFGNLISNQLWLGQNKEALGNLRYINEVLPDHSVAAESNVRALYSYKQDPVAALDYLSNFKGSLNVKVQSYHSALLAVTGNISKAIALLANESDSFERFKQSYVMVLDAMQSNSDLINEQMTFERLNLSSDQMEEILLELKVTKGDFKVLLDHTDYQFSSVDEFEKKWQAKPYGNLVNYALIQKYRGNAQYANSLIKELNSFAKICLKTEGRISTACPAALYLTTDMNQDELMKITRTSLMLLDTEVGFEKYLLTSPSWLFLHGHADFKPMAEEFLDNSYRKWAKQGNNLTAIPMPDTGKAE